jgi:hypothetical protein
MILRTPTDNENTGSHPETRHAGAGRHPGAGGGWIPACAGMTEQRVVIDAQIIAARVFSKEDTKFGGLIFAVIFFFLVAASPR